MNKKSLFVILLFIVLPLSLHDLILFPLLISWLGWSGYIALVAVLLGLCFRC